MADYDDDDDDEIYRGEFENGHWEWSEKLGGLEFVSHVEPTLNVVETYVPIAAGLVEFSDNIDVLEQQKFIKRFRRKNIRPEEVVTLQDIKDFVLFTAPKGLLNPAIVSILHLPITERFIRALIIYCQYYIQISEEMHNRMSELQSKVRTSRGDAIEMVFRENLQDLRLLVAKEYCSIIVGSGDFAKYHHKGLLKRNCTLTKKEKVLSESLLCLSIQIVWIAVGRRMHNQIEMEINRIFKSDIYNVTEHRLRTNYRLVLDKREEAVLFGHCLKQGVKLTTHSPLMNEVQCDRDVDYRLMGLGVVKFPSLSHRLRFFERVLIAPEDLLKEYNVSLGILGKPRSSFDTTLREIKMSSPTGSATNRKSTSRLKSASSKISKTSKISTCSGKSSRSALPLCDEIIIPDKEELSQCLPDLFPEEEVNRMSICESQRKKWLIHITRLHKNKQTRSKCIIHS